MKRLVLLEWREISRDLRSWLVALLPVFLFSFARTLAPAIMDMSSLVTS